MAEAAGVSCSAGESGVYLMVLVSAEADLLRFDAFMLCTSSWDTVRKQHESAYFFILMPKKGECAERNSHSSGVLTNLCDRTGTHGPAGSDQRHRRQPCSHEGGRQRRGAWWGNKAQSRLQLGPLRRQNSDSWSHCAQNCQQFQELTSSFMTENKHDSHLCLYSRHTPSHLHCQRI